VDSDLPAEILFSGLALRDTADAAWDVGNVSCDNSYCHGNWSLAKEQSNNSFIYTADKIEGNAASPKWTDPATAACGTCHNLPPKGHTPFDLTACTGCHNTVINADGKIIDKTKHVNGMINVFGVEFPIF
jgi:predicted CxxxxCH...CXXCH cytochrome family protein